MSECARHRRLEKEIASFVMWMGEVMDILDEAGVPSDRNVRYGQVSDGSGMGVCVCRFYVLGGTGIVVGTAEGRGRWLSW